MRYLLDTSALLAHYRQEAGWDTVQALFDDEATELIIAVVTLTEFGRRLRDLGQAEDAILDTLNDYQLLFSEIVSINVTVAQTALAIGYKTPQRLPLVDALIAAAASDRAAILVHRDEHMRAIPEEMVTQQELSANVNADD
ncbi:MAG: PIN domain-containing protein [Caldilineaceae bacterium]|nr:PIN domain-containing protein [Caldilineaceae bacterium]